MVSTRLVTGVGGVALLAAWMAAANADQPTTSPPSIAPIQVPDGSLDGLHEQTDRLRERLRRMPSPVRAERNPFRFADRTAVVPRPLTRGREAEPESTRVSHPAGLRLIGIAETRRGDELVRTAIVSGDGQTFLVMLGDTVAAFTVHAISADAVELVNPLGGAPVVLVLN